eukprot:COSAG06_NODE_13398_length_1259_cov_1.018072_1_plen_101_part_10
MAARARTLCVGGPEADAVADSELVSGTRADFDDVADGRVAVFVRELKGHPFLRTPGGNSQTDAIARSVCQSAAAQSDWQAAEAGSQQQNSRVAEPRTCRYL